MLRRIFSAVMFILLVISMLTLALNIQPVRASGTIYIRADGSIGPPSAPIQRDGDVYTFTDDIYDSIVLQKNNIIIDGAGKTVQGTEEFDSRGIDLSNRVNVTVRNTKITDFYYGVCLNYSSSNSISGNNIIANNTFCIWLYSSSDISISGNNITNNWIGIDLESSSSNSISGNNITDNDSGIDLGGSSNNSISGNNITNSMYGISLYFSSSNSISGNTLLNNGLMVWDSYENLVTGNLVNGKPLVYLEGLSGYSVGNAGQVVLVNCINIRVENLNLSNASWGIDLWSTNNTIISGNSIANNVAGISLEYGSNNVISGNNVTANYGDGIYLLYSSGNSIVENNITANDYDGFDLLYSSGNSIVGNNITNNRYYGIYLGDCSNIMIFHNNFIDNPQQAYVETAGFANVWDNYYPSGGNYWSDYNGTDANHDGIGDTPYIIDADNQDGYPLMHPYTAISGDINQDRTVDMSDAILAALAFGSYPGHPNWNSKVDLNQDNKIDILDMIILASNFGKHS